MQGGRLMCYHAELFHGALLECNPTYDKELLMIIKMVNKWKNYLLGKETIIHIDNRPLK